VKIKRRKREPGPEFLVQPCECQQPGCKKFFVGIRHPLMREWDDTSGELVPCALFRAENGPELIRRIAELCEYAGLPVGNPLAPVLDGRDTADRSSGAGPEAK